MCRRWVADMKNCQKTPGEVEYLTEHTVGERLVEESDHV